MYRAVVSRITAKSALAVRTPSIPSCSWRTRALNAPINKRKPSFSLRRNRYRAELSEHGLIKKDLELKARQARRRQDMLGGSAMFVYFLGVFAVTSGLVRCCKMLGEYFEQSRISDGVGDDGARKQQVQ